MRARSLIVPITSVLLAGGVIAAAFLIRGLPGLPTFSNNASLPPDRQVPWVEPPGRFEPSGGRIKTAPASAVPGGFLDYADRVLYLRGLAIQPPPGLSPAEPAVSSGARAPSFDFAALRDAGINVITLPIRWQDLEPGPMELSVPRLLAIRAFLDRAASAGMAVILVNTTPLSSQPACAGLPDAPVWAFRMPSEDTNFSDGDCPASRRDRTPANNRFYRDFIQGSWTPDDLALQDHLIRAWTKLAELVSRSPGLAGYALADGMTCPEGLDATECSQAWTGFIDRFANNIRAVDRSAIIFLDTEAPASGVTGLDILLTEFVPGSADDSSRGLLNDLPPGSFTLDHSVVTPGAALIARLDAAERRGRSILLTMPRSSTPAASPQDGILALARELARPLPLAVAGRNLKFSFDRLTLPQSADEVAAGPGQTDVFTLEFTDGERATDSLSETTIWLPVKTLYRTIPDSDAPAWTVEISDGSADWLPGRSDVIIWRTVNGGPHRLRLIPWGGRRLGVEQGPVPNHTNP
ncbi:MAG TPA: hypothetical protein PLZ31_10840 [Myxococcota bacterium]|nr:hypothetical protein [Myxococcota bacterium]HPB51705.1 hypothetical protein [Myxococcota bacterium]